MVHYEWSKEMNSYEMLGFYRRLEEWSRTHTGKETASGVITLNERSMKLGEFDLTNRDSWRERHQVRIITESNTVPEMFFLATEGFMNTGDGW